MRTTIDRTRPLGRARPLGVLKERGSPSGILGSIYTSRGFESVETWCVCIYMR